MFALFNVLGCGFSVPTVRYVCATMDKVRTQFIDFGTFPLDLDSLAIPIHVLLKSSFGRSSSVTIIHGSKVVCLARHNVSRVDQSIGKCVRFDEPAIQTNENTYQH